MTALNGTRSRFTRRNRFQPGIARSRENAYQVRDALVKPAAPQNSWPTVAIRITSFAAHESSAEVKMTVEYPAPSSIALTFVAANRNDSSRTQPMMAEKKTERQTPCAAAFAAPWVSSAVWAEAS